MRILRGLKAPALLTTLALSATVVSLTGCGALMQPSTGSGSSVKAVGSIDQEAIYELPEFKKVNKEIEDEYKELEKKIPKIAAGKQPTPAQQAQLNDLRTKLQQDQNKKVNPLKTKVEAAIASVARSKGLMVVLDKKIVVCGVDDVTEDVKKAFEAPGDIKMGDEVDTSKSPVGYFDQEVVRALRAFQEADMDIYRRRGELGAKYLAKAKAAPPNERPILEQSFQLELQNYRQQVMTPLEQKVTDSVKEVAAAQNVQLVLDKQHVMHGGRNLTNEVVESFLKKVGGGPAASGIPHASPTAGAPLASPSPAGTH